MLPLEADCGHQLMVHVVTDPQRKVEPRSRILPAHLRYGGRHPCLQRGFATRQRGGDARYRCIPGVPLERIRVLQPVVIGGECLQCMAIFAPARGNVLEWHPELRPGVRDRCGVTARACEDGNDQHPVAGRGLPGDASAARQHHVIQVRGEVDVLVAPVPGSSHPASVSGGCPPRQPGKRALGVCRIATDSEGKDGMGQKRRREAAVLGRSAACRRCG